MAKKHAKMLTLEMPKILRKLKSKLMSLHNEQDHQGKNWTKPKVMVKANISNEMKKL